MIFTPPNTLKDPFKNLNSSWNSPTTFLQMKARSCSTTRRQAVKRNASVGLETLGLNIDFLSNIVTKLDFPSNDASASFILGVFTGMLSQFSYEKSEKHRNRRGELPSFNINSGKSKSEDVQAFVGSISNSIAVNHTEQANWFNKIV